MEIISFYFIIGYYLKRKIENNSVRNSPALQDHSPPFPQTQDTSFPVEPLETRPNEQVQINPPRRVRKQHENGKENQNNVPKKRGRKPKSKTNSSM